MVSYTYTKSGAEIDEYGKVSQENDWLKRNLETITNNPDNTFNEEQVQRAKTMLSTLKVNILAITRQDTI
ncbi:8022_t:CDS:2 [Diversispora eburnea]|uniref:8022_t:CDS:1 n=1 Tax=Diversispora eburnea TaxID=1213867 RepID=A0A9N9BV80_9GLOM|nr:8022_t:CDS:2 [Diversispora eburnea]